MCSSGAMRRPDSSASALKERLNGKCLNRFILS
ncbi:hypothetical protein MTBUT4_120044 [Magnetospirillum sp. UT-4]|nr:hypothetical protein MTBUT4_120044 [Magnetospirillum sp. UT-4]